MQQPLIPAGGGDIRHADTISNLDFMMRNPGQGDNHNAGVFAECYARMGDIIPELVHQGRNPRIMLDYSGELLYGLRKMGRHDVIDRLKRITCDWNYRKYVEWLGTMWGHAVASSTPVPDLKLHMRAWQQYFAAIFGWDALGRVRGFSPPEMHLPNHPDVAYEYVKALKECGYNWLLVQEHSVETLEGKPLGFKHLPHRLLARNSEGEELSIIAVIKTQGSDTKLVAQMQPFYEAQSLQRQEVGGICDPAARYADRRRRERRRDDERVPQRLPPGDLPLRHRRRRRRQCHGVPGADRAGRREGTDAAGLPADQPGPVFERIKKWEPGAADKAIADIKKEKPNFSPGRRLLDEQHQLGEGLRERADADEQAQRRLPSGAR